MNIAAIITLLDVIHDYLLCPIFGDKDKDLEEIKKRLDNIQQQIEEMKNGKST